MKRNISVAVWTACALVAVTFCFSRFPRWSEPSIEGTPITVWLDQNMVGPDLSGQNEARAVLQSVSPGVTVWLGQAAATRPPALPGWAYSGMDALENVVPPVGAALKKRVFRTVAVNFTALNALSEMDEMAVPAIPFVAPLVASNDALVAGQAATILANTMPGSLPELTRIFGSGSVQTRRTILGTIRLFQFEGKSDETYAAAVRFLMKALDDPDAEVRTLAARSLGFHRVVVKDTNFGCLRVPVRVNPPLARELEARFIRALSDAEPKVRQCMVELLSRSPATEALELPLVLWSLAHDPADEVRTAVAESLGKGELPKEGRGLATLRKLANDSNAQCRLAAAVALSHHRERADHVVAALILRLRVDDPATREQALLDLQRIGTPAADAALPAMLEAMRVHDAPSDTLRSLAWGFARFGSVALPSVVELLAHPNPGVRLGAVQYFYFDDPRIKPALSKLAEDPDPAVQAAVAEKLNRLR